MDKVFCAHCGYVFGKDGDGGKDTVTIMLEAEKNFQHCPKCTKPLELSIGDVPASTVEVMQGIDIGKIKVVNLGKQDRPALYPTSRPYQPISTSFLFKAVLMIAVVTLSQIILRQPWWTTASFILQIGIGLGCLLIALALAYLIDRLFHRRS